MIGDMKPGFSSEAAYDPNDVLVDSEGILTREVTLVSGQNVLRGAVLGKITTGGKYKLSASADSDGSQTPVAVAMQDVDATGGDKKIQVYLNAKVRPSKLIFGTGHTAASTFEALAKVGIQLVSEQLY